MSNFKGGNLKVELFDNTTKSKVKELKSHNFISAMMKDYYYKFALNSLFSKGVAFNPMPSTEIGWYEDFYRYMGNPFGEMILTTYDKAEKPNSERWSDGDLVGYAYSTIDGGQSDTHKGYFNALESILTSNKVKMVFDFPTNTANGTFQSVYFGFDDFPISYDGLLYLDKLPTKENMLRGMEDNKRITVRDGKLFTLRNYKDREPLLAIENLETGELIDVLGSDILGDGYSGLNISDFEVVGSDLYISFASDYDYDIYMTPVESYGVVKYNLNSKVVEQKYRYGDSLYALTYNSSKQQFIAMRGSEGYAWDYELVYYNKDFEVLTYRSIDYNISYDSMPYPSSRLDTSLVMDNYDGVLFVNYESQRNRVKRSVRLIEESNRGYVYKDTLGGHAIKGVYDENYLIGINGSLLPKGNFTSRVLLPEPVSKTALNTMKVTYDFVLPKLGS